MKKQAGTFHCLKWPSMSWKLSSQPEQIRRLYTISCLKIHDKHDFFFLTALISGAYYAPRVEKSGQKWASLNILYLMIKVLPKGLSTPCPVLTSETLCCEEITRRGLTPKGD